MPRSTPGTVFTELSKNKRRYRIIVLGAGFSRPAGLPLAKELYAEIPRRVEAQFGRDNWLSRDLEDYIGYRSRCDGVHLKSEEVDFEEFLSFLDTEHYLGLRGSDTWSSHGNESQVLVKEAIGKIIHDRTPSVSDMPPLYVEFAESLLPGDYVLTFNYDVLLERALEHVKKGFRLFPTRFEEIRPLVNIVDSSRSEVVVLKMHGSVDWFSQPAPDFAHAFLASPIVDGPREEEDPLTKLKRIRKIDKFYSQGWPSATPAILSPSHSKVLYSSRLHDFWHGAGQSGAWHLGFSIIGFSLSHQDAYIRQALYRMVRNYQEMYWGDDFGIGVMKSKLKLVDCPATSDERKQLLGRYAFIDWSRAVGHMAGFDHKALELVFADDH